MRNERDEDQTEPWTGLLIAYADTRLAAPEIRPEFICSGTRRFWGLIYSKAGLFADVASVNGFYGSRPPERLHRW